jgi:hypothetical protein
MDEINADFAHHIISGGTLVRPICKVAIEKINFIERAIQLSLYDFDFMYDWQLKRDVHQ